MKKKLFGLAVAGAMSMALLAGCGTEDVQSAVTDATEGTELEEAGQQAADALEDVDTDAVADEVSDAADEAAEVVDDAANLADIKENLVYMGGLYVSNEDCDLSLAIFKNDGDQIAIVTQESDVNYGIFTTEEATLDDGTVYNVLTFENGDSFGGYAFNEDLNGGIIVMADGTVYEAESLDESAALDMVDLTF